MKCRLAAVLLASVAAGVAEAGEKQAKKLFDGKSFEGWTYFLNDPEAKMKDVWSIEEGGVLRCKGRPVGYLMTKDTFSDYELTLQWRWPDKPGNNGVLIHASQPNVLGPWPKSLECQLAHENAGDFWVIGTTIEVDDPENRTTGRRTVNYTDDSEKPLGEWNDYKIIAKGGDVKVYVNGTLVNEGRNSSVTEGAICLQSEGALIEYRDIMLKPLD